MSKKNDPLITSYRRSFMRSFDMGAAKTKLTVAAAFLLLVLGAPFSVKASTLLYSQTATGGSEYGANGVPVNWDNSFTTPEPGYITSGTIYGVELLSVRLTGADSSGYFYFVFNGVTSNCQSSATTLNTLGITSSFNTSPIQIAFTGSDCANYTYPFSTNTIGLHWSGFIPGSLIQNGAGSFLPINIYAGGFPVTDTTTRIDSVDPFDGEEVASTSPVTIGATGYVNESDFRDSLWGHTMLRIQILNNSCNTGTGLGFGSNAFGVNADDPCRVDYEYEIPSSGDFSYSTSTPLDEGLYDMNIQVSRGTLFNLAFDPLVSTSTSFKVGVLGYLDNAILEIREYSSSVFGGSATSSCSLLMENPFSSTTIGNFLGCVFIPDSGSITSLMEYTKRNVLTRVPFGYATRIYDIVTATSSTALPDISYTFPASFPLDSFAGETFYFSPWQYFYVDGSPLKDELLSTESEPKNAWEIVEPLFTFLVYFVLVMMVIRDLMGIDLTGGVTTIEREVDVLGTGTRNKGQVVRSHHTISRSKRL